MLKQFQQVLELVAASTQTHSELRISLNILRGLIEQLRFKSLDVSPDDLAMFSNVASNTFSASSSKGITIQSDTSLALNSVLSEYLFEFTRRLA